MSKKLKDIAKISLILLCALAGGKIAQPYLNAPPATVFAVPPVNIYNADGSQREQMQVFYGSNDKKALDIGLWHGAPVQDFYSRDGTLRLQFGTYLGDVRADEAGLPLIGFNDAQARLKLLLRLDRSNEAPLVILKDASGANKLIMGLALYDTYEDPFLVYADSHGDKHMVFGEFDQSIATGTRR